MNKTPHAVIGDTTSGSVRTGHDLSLAVPIDVISPFKSQKGAFDEVKGVIVPYLTLESATYRFGVGQSSTQEFSLRGDSIYYAPGMVYQEDIAYNPSSGHPLTLPLTFPVAPGSTGTPGTAATLFQDGADSVHVLSVTLCNSTTGAYKRLFYGDGALSGYTDSTGDVIITATHAGYDTVRVAYAGDGTINYAQSVHQGVSVKPAAVRGKDISVWIGPGATPVYQKFTGVQTAEIDWKSNVTNVSELGNHHYASQDTDIPDLTGNLTTRPIDVGTLWAQIYAVTDVDPTQVIGPNVTTPVPMYIAVHDPNGAAGVDNTGILKTFYVPDARFTVPGFQGQANQATQTQFNWSSDTGAMLIFDGGTNNGTPLPFIS